MAGLTNVTVDCLLQEQEILQIKFVYWQMHVLQRRETGRHFVKYLCMLDVFSCITKSAFFSFLDIWLPIYFKLLLFQFSPM